MLSRRLRGSRGHGARPPTSSASRAAGRPRLPRGLYPPGGRARRRQLRICCRAARLPVAPWVDQARGGGGRCVVRGAMVLGLRPAVPRVGRDDRCRLGASTRRAVVLAAVSSGSAVGRLASPWRRGSTRPEVVVVAAWFAGPWCSASDQQCLAWGGTTAIASGPLPAGRRSSPSSASLSSAPDLALDQAAGRVSRHPTPWGMPRTRAGPNPRVFHVEHMACGGIGRWALLGCRAVGQPCGRPAEPVSYAACPLRDIR